MFEKVKFGTRIAVVVALLLIPAAATVYGMIPLSFWKSLVVSGEEAAQNVGGYPYWKNCLATGSNAALLIFLGVLNPRFLKTGFLLIFGLIFSIIGDGFMKQGNLLGGIGFFGLGHLCFMTFFLLNGKLNRWGVLALSLLFAAYLPYFFVELRPKLSNTLLTGAVLFYLSLSIFSLSAACLFNTKPWIRLLAVSGIASILFSDTVIAEKIFCERATLWILMMPTYLLTHFLLTAAVVLDFLLVKTGGTTEIVKRG